MTGVIVDDLIANNWFAIRIKRPYETSFTDLDFQCPEKMNFNEYIVLEYNDNLRGYWIQHKVPLVRYAAMGWYREAHFLDGTIIILETNGPEALKVLQVSLPPITVKLSSNQTDSTGLLSAVVGDFDENQEDCVFIRMVFEQIQDFNDNHIGVNAFWHPIGFWNVIKYQLTIIKYQIYTLWMLILENIKIEKENKNG